MLRERGGNVGFEASGHADFGDNGTDIVCSAISALTQTALIGLEQVLKLQIGASLDENGIYCVLDRNTEPDMQQKAQLILDTMEAGLEAIKRQYPNTLTISSREV